MRKTKIIYSSSPDEVDSDVQEWIDEQNSSINKNIEILHINGAFIDNGDVITYILYTE